ncbi:MAG: DUF1501 domain-containing protein [SAR202 cluster bacterium]|nr:DUF1501 domain-containing protein [SAR202 cluster bacterium]
MVAAKGNGHRRTTRPKNLVVIQLSGGNDYLNTVVPYNDGRYYDYRPVMGLKGESVLPLDDRVGFNAEMRPIKRMFDQGKVAVVMGVGYPEPNRSHFRSMDIWHTAEPSASSAEGWLGKTTKVLDPEGANPVTAVNFGRGLPRALAYPGVSVASVGQLEAYGFLTGIAGAAKRDALLDVMARIYQPSGEQGWVSERLLGTGQGALRGADILQEAPAKYKSTVEYPADNAIAQSLKGIAQVLTARVGTRIFYANHGSFDTHTNELVNHARLWRELSIALDSFWQDLEEHDAADDTVIMMFSEFGRRIADNGSGTDHGSGGVSFLIGNAVKGGLYGEYPGLAPAEQLDGDVRFNTDFRQVYASVLEQLLDVEATAVLKSQFEQLQMAR